MKSLEALNGEKTYAELSEETKEMLKEVAYNKDGSVKNSLIHRRLILRRFETTEDYDELTKELKHSFAFKGDKVKPPAYLK